jgi:predicted AlkP superfamily pyrophosphatase or phosphodiesterase
VSLGLAALLALALGALAAAPGADADTGRRHVVLVSLDGLRPEFYLDDAWPAPTLRELVRAGAHARAVEPVFPSMTYPGHASIVTGVRPARHGILFNVRFEPSGARGRWYEEASDLRAPPLWEWARAAGLRTAAVSWPSTLGAGIDLLLPERDYYARPDPLPMLVQAAMPGLFERLGVAPRPEVFRDPIEWDGFLTDTAAAMIRHARPHLLLLHLVQLDVFQHKGGRQAAELRPALLRIDAHLARLRAALKDAGIGERAVVLVTGDHGFTDVTRLVAPNEILARAGLRRCPSPGESWRATTHLAGAGAAVFVNPPGDAEARARAEAALRREARDRYRVLTRAELDQLGAMPGAALGLEAAPGFGIVGSCGRRQERAGRGGTHGYLPWRAEMATGLVVAGSGVRPGAALARARLIDVAPTVARLLGLAPPALEGRVLEEFLQ